MAFSIRRDILAQLGRIGLQIKPSMLRVPPPRETQEILGESGLGRTFSIELPGEDNHIEEEVLCKTLKSNISFIDEVHRKRTTNEGESNQILLQVNLNYIVKELFTDLNKNNITKLFSANENFHRPTIVEYSSPNIAKPFHVGNLRSTIIGNSLANILQFTGHNVVRMNYLGDWGTQFGILSYAYDHFGNETKLRVNPMKHLFEVYVKGNQEIEKNSNWREAAKKRFTELEHKDNPKTVDQWTHFRELSLQELKQLYQRLGVEFDVYSSESMYSESSLDTVNMLQNQGITEKSADGAVVACVPNCRKPEEIIRVPVLKNDGSTLYITRDIAAALDRKQQYDFAQMYYVVDTSQAGHFNSLRSILSSMGNPIYKDMEHVRFGRIKGMSTRKGTTIFLDDVLNEAKDRALEATKASPNTKISQEEYDRVGDILGVSTIIIQDLAHRRVSDFNFDWDKALRLNGDTGTSLQYTHARMCNLQKNCGVPLNLDCDIDMTAIDSLEGRLLIHQLAMFRQTIEQSHAELEPSVLCNYLFHLKRGINRANLVLTVKGQEAKMAETRLTLFHCARTVLHRGMTLLGLRPLDSM